MRTLPTIRVADPGDLGRVQAVLRSAGFGTQVGRLLGLPLDSAEGTVLLAGSEDPSGVVAALVFPGSRSGWIGALGVRPDARRSGLGRALTGAAIDWLAGRGAESVGLFATDEGRGLYEQLGFTPADRAVAWRGRLARPPSGTRVAVRALTEDDRAEVKAIDRAQTGEDRTPLLDRLQPLEGWAATGGDGRLLGFALETPWGAACPVLATDDEAGVALMAAVASGPGGGTLIVPEANEAATGAVSSWRLGRLNDALRMHLGPPPARLAAGQFATFNLFWG